MIRQRVSFVVAGAIVATTALTAGLATPASAAPTIYDPTFVPGATDLVGVGSDTSEIVMNYLAEGHDGMNGFNSGKTTGRLASFAAGIDPPTIVLREGMAPITRPNGSGNGKKTLYGTSNIPEVSFARSSSSLNSAEVSAGLKQYAFAVDGMKLGVSKSATNAPAGITATDMVKIYEGTYDNWGDIPGYTGPAAAATIKAYVPQSGSGTYSFFVDQLRAANGGNAVNISGNAETQEHSDVDIKDDPNAIVPFSTARARTQSAGTIKMLGGFKAYRAIYNVVRGSDLSGAVGPQLEGVFASTGFLCSETAKPLIEAAGFDQLASPTANGLCGVSTAEPVSNFTTTSQVDTETFLAAEALFGYKVRLTATVDASTSPEGTVTFKQGDAVVGDPVPVTDGKAVKTLTMVTPGDYSYSATFAPSDSLAFTESTSTTVATSVKTPSSISAGLLSASGTYGSTRLLAVGATVDGEPATGSVSVKVDNGSPVLVPLIGGSAFYVVPGNLAVGAHTVTATLQGTATSAEAVRTIPLTVKKATTKASFKFADATIKAKITPKATATVVINGAASSIKPSGKITLRYGSKIVGTGTVRNGVAKVSLKKFKKKSSAYSVKATFTSTNSNYSSSPASAAVKIKVS